MRKSYINTTLENHLRKVDEYPKQHTEYLSESEAFGLPAGKACDLSMSKANGLLANECLRSNYLGYIFAPV